MINRLTESVYRRRGTGALRGLLFAAFLVLPVFFTPRPLHCQEDSWVSRSGLGLRALWLGSTARDTTSTALSAAPEGGRTERVVVGLRQGADSDGIPGLRLTALSGGVAAGYLDLAGLPLAASHPAVESIRLERKYHPNDDLGLFSSRVMRSRQRTGLTGRNVIVGIMDSGIDWTHPAFLDSAGGSRILALLDMSEPPDSLGPGDLGNAGPYGGILVTREDINSALAGRGTVRQRDLMGHGTHVAGVAAGSAGTGENSGMRYGGVAPEADIVAIKLATTPRDSSFSDFNIMNGLASLNSLAATAGKPWVCNMSFGGSLGPHDGTDPLERFIASFVAGSEPGRAVVVASGNERSKRLHARGDFGIIEGDSLDLSVRVIGQGGPAEYLRVEVWLSAGHPGIELSLVSPEGEVYGPWADGYASPDTIVTAGGVLMVDNAHGGPVDETGDRLVALEIYDLAYVDPGREGNTIQIAQGTWSLRMKGAGGWFDAYLYSHRAISVAFESHFTELGTVGTPATHPKLIAVGAYTVRGDWLSIEGPAGSSGEIYFGTTVPGSLTYFTSLGPNRKGVLKPELTAPGRWVIGPLGRDAWPLGEPLSIYESPLASRPLALVTADSIHGVSQGTSFSAPHVAGICALLFEAVPALSNSGIRDLLTTTAATDSMAATAPDNYWGWGRANTAGAVRSLLGAPADTVAIRAALDPPDTLFSDTLYLTVTKDFSASAQKLRSFILRVDWPAELLRFPGTEGFAPGERLAALELDTTAVSLGSLTVRGGVSDTTLSADTLFRMSLVPRGAARMDSVLVSMEALSLAGDLPPHELADRAALMQAEPVSLRPLEACIAAGDVDRSGGTDVFDLIALLRVMAGKEPAGVCSDLDRDNDTDIFDLLELLRIISGRKS